MTPLAVCGRCLSLTNPAPVLIRDVETGERKVVPMRYRCRLPGWTEADEVAKPGSYNARMDKLSTVGWPEIAAPAVSHPGEPRAADYEHEAVPDETPSIHPAGRPTAMAA